MFGEKENTEEKIMKAALDILQREGLAYDGNGFYN